MSRVINYGMIYLYIPRSFYSQGRKRFSSRLLVVIGLEAGRPGESGLESPSPFPVSQLPLKSRFLSVHRQAETHPDSYSADTESPAPTLKRPNREDGPSHPRRVILRSLCSYTSSTPPYTFMVWRLIRNMGKFTSLLNRPHLIGLTKLQFIHSGYVSPTCFGLYFVIFSHDNTRTYTVR
jgi:hypothetical protein